MRIPGYCTACRRIKQVRVTTYNPMHKVQMGMCSACQQKEDDERRTQRR